MQLAAREAAQTINEMDGAEESDSELERAEERRELDQSKR